MLAYATISSYPYTNSFYFLGLLSVIIIICPQVPSEFRSNAIVLWIRVIDCNQGGHLFRRTLESGEENWNIQRQIIEYICVLMASNNNIFNWRVFQVKFPGCCTIVYCQSDTSFMEDIKC